MQALQKRVISREHYERAHQGIKNWAKRFQWSIEENPDPTDPKLLTLEMLALEKPAESTETELPVVRDYEGACGTCANRHNAPGDGPCAKCDLTIDGPNSNYSAESDAPYEDDDEDDDTVIVEAPIIEPKPASTPPDDESDGFEEE